MLNYSGLRKNSANIFYVALRDQAAATLSFKANPTIAAGDFKVSIDGGAFANLTTLPTVTPAAGRAVKISLSAAEMNGDNIFVQCVDAAGAEWCDEAINIQTTPLDASLVQVDGTPNVSATLNLTKLNVVNSGGDAVVFSSTGGNGAGLKASGNGSGSGIVGIGGLTGNGLLGQGGATSGYGMYALAVAATYSGFVAQGVTSGSGILSAGGASGSGITASGQGAGNGFISVGGITGHGVFCVGGATSGAGLLAAATGSGNGLQCSGAAGGAGAYFIGNGAGDGVIAQAGATGNGLHCIGGATSGSGLVAAAVTSGTGITAFGVGSVSLLATQGISGPLDTSERNAIAVAGLKYDWTLVSGEANFSTLNALRYNRNWSISGTTLTIWADAAHTVPAYTATLTTDAAGVPVVGFAS